MSDRDALQRLVDAVARYLSAKGQSGPWAEDEWMQSFNGLLQALRDARAALERG